MISFSRYACAAVLGLTLIAGCKQEPATGQGSVDYSGSSNASSSTAKQSEIPAATQSVDELLEMLQLDSTYHVVEKRQQSTKRGRAADVVAIDYTEGSVRDVSKLLRGRLVESGFGFLRTEQVRGGVRMSFASADKQKVSVMVRNQKHLKDLDPKSKGRISLTYVGN